MSESQIIVIVIIIIILKAVIYCVWHIMEAALHLTRLIFTTTFTGKLTNNNNLIQTRK